MSSLRVLIVDDELLARQKLRRYLAAEPDVVAITECANAAQAAEAIRQQRPDIVFLDVQMPDIDGFDLLRSVGGDATGQAVFVTANRDYAVRAFEVEALDYLLKPFYRTRLKAALGRARQLRAMETTVGELARSPATADTRDAAHRRIALRTGGRIVPIAIDEIEWIESADNYVRVYSAQQSHLARHTLAALEEQLDPHRFLRIHRRVIVNVDFLAEIRRRPHGGYEAQLQNGRTLRVGRMHRSAFRRFFFGA